MSEPEDVNAAFDREWSTFLRDVPSTIAIFPDARMLENVRITAKSLFHSGVNCGMDRALAKMRDSRKARESRK